MRILLIGNGPSALAKDLGEEIDTFDGKVVRFSDFRTKGYEDKVGSRTDIWVTTSSYGSHLRTVFDDVHVMTWGYDRECKSHIAVKKWFPDTEKFSGDVINKTREIMGFSTPSTGAVTVQFFNGHEIWIYGFDFFMQKQAHYADNLYMGDNHSPEKEWDYFNKLIQEGKIKQFGYNPELETMPLIRQPVPCGTDENIKWARQPVHEGWYKWFAEMSNDKIILDVGAGICEGMKVLEENGAREAFGFEVDSRLFNDKLMIWNSLKPYPTNSVDVVTCVDVIEHCVNDRELLNEMKRIAREKIFITTPNYTRSKCHNLAHCREYTIAQFMNFFKPDEVWSASPDGKVHRTKLMHRVGDTILDYSPQGPMNKLDKLPVLYNKEVPVTKRFNHTVDGKEWGHICGIFEV
ncbi:MAG: glycosyltransferase family 29 protein [Candidatus Hodarchaeota archaeon]